MVVVILIIMFVYVYFFAEFKLAKRTNLWKRILVFREPGDRICHEYCMCREAGVWLARCNYLA